MNLTIDMMLNLRKNGFTFNEFENDCDPGMVFYYNDCEYSIGGKWDGTPCSVLDQAIANNGVWLPDESDLMLWLQWKCNYNVVIKYVASERYFYGTAEGDEGKIFKGSGPDLLCCLYKLVLKICKNNQLS